MGKIRSNTFESRIHTDHQFTEKNGSRKRQFVGPAFCIRWLEYIHFKECIKECITDLANNKDRYKTGLEEQSHLNIELFPTAK